MSISNVIQKNIVPEKVTANDMLTITVTRNGKVISKLTPESKSGVFAKFLNFLGIKHYTTDLVVTAGLGKITDGVSGIGSLTAFTAIAYGEGTTPAARADTALESEVARETADSITRTTTTYTNDTVHYETEFTIGVGGAVVTEVGILDNAVSGGNMLARQVFAAQNLLENDKFKVEWDVVFN